MDRVFLDANVLFSAAYRDDAGVRGLWSLPGTALLTSSYALEEARRNLREEGQRSALEKLAGEMDVVDARTLPEDLRGHIELPEKDWPIVAGALKAEATHLITGDLRDFGPYLGGEILGIRVLTPAAYLNR